MNTKKLYFWLLIFASLNLLAQAEELPPEYKPFTEFIGHWHGPTKLVIDSSSGKGELRFDHEVEYRYNPERGAIEVIEIDTEAKAGIRITTYSEIRWDEPSKCFKSMAWTANKMARLYVVKYQDGVFDHDRVDRPEGVEFASQVSISDIGELVHIGKQSSSGARQVKMYWSNTCTKKEPSDSE